MLFSYFARLLLNRYELLTYCPRYNKLVPELLRVHRILGSLTWNPNTAIIHLIEKVLDSRTIWSARSITILRPAQFNSNSKVNT